MAVQKVHPSLLKLRCGKGNVELKGEDAQPKEKHFRYGLSFRFQMIRKLLEQISENCRAPFRTFFSAKLKPFTHPHRIYPEKYSSSVFGHFDGIQSVNGILASWSLCFAQQKLLSVRDRFKFCVN